MDKKGFVSYGNLSVLTGVKAYHSLVLHTRALLLHRLTQSDQTEEKTSKLTNKRPRKLFLMDYFSYSSVRTQNAFNIEANWRGGVGQDNDIHNENIPLPSLFTEKLVLLRVEVDGNA